MNPRTSKISDLVSVQGEFLARVFRADGRIEQKRLRNQVTANGLNTIAARALGENTPAVAFIGIGTFAATSSLGSANFGEVDRKAILALASSVEWIYGVATWGGAADSITSVDIGAGALLNHTNSGSGYVFNIVTDLSTVLANSDFLHLTARIRVGSHAL